MSTAREVAAQAIGDYFDPDMASWDTTRTLMADAVLAALRWDELTRLPDQWEDASSEWYYEHRHNPDNTIDYAQGYEDGWDHAASLLRAHFAALSEALAPLAEIGDETR